MPMPISFFFFKFLEYSLFTMLLGSGVQQSESVMHISTFISILFPYKSLQSIE